MDRTQVRRDATCRGIWQVVFGLEVRLRRRAPRYFREDFQAAIRYSQIRRRRDTHQHTAREPRWDLDAGAEITRTSRS
jgi:hypothetical protein